MNRKSDHSPGEAVLHVLASSGKSPAAYHSYRRPMWYFTRYCLTPPVYPTWVQPRDKYRNRGGTTPVPRLCIACGKVHITSEDCGRERPEPTRRTSVPRRHDGYTLQQARNMGLLDDVDNWEHEA